MVTSIKQTKYWLARMWGKKEQSSLVGIQICTATMKTNMGGARLKKNKLKIEIPYYPPIPLLSVYLQKMKQTKDILADSSSLQYCSHALSYRITLECITRYIQVYMYIYIYLYVYKINGYYILYIIEVSPILFLHKHRYKLLFIHKRNYAIWKKMSKTKHVT